MSEVFQFVRDHGPFVIIPNQLVRSLCVSRRGGCAIGRRTNGRGRVVSSGQGLLLLLLHEGKGYLPATNLFLHSKRHE